MDVTENEKEYQLLAELPDVKNEEISITINGDAVLELTLPKKAPASVERGGMHRSMPRE